MVTDFKTCKEDIEIDVDELLQENLQYKSLQKTLLTQVQIIENKMKELKSEIQILHSEQSRLKSNEQFLKKVVKSLARNFGVENIKKIIEAQGLEFPLDFQGSNEATRNMKYSSCLTNMNQNYNSASYYSSDSYSDEMDGNYTQQPSAQGVLHDYPVSSSYSEYEQPYDESSLYHTSQLKEEHVQIEKIKENEMNNTNWLDRVERQQFNVDSFLGSGENLENKILEVDDLFSGENPLISRTRF